MYKRQSTALRPVWQPASAPAAASTPAQPTQRRKQMCIRDSGKSTLLKILLGWLPEYRGTGRYDGQDVRAFTPEQLQQQMSYIEQDLSLIHIFI